MTSPERAGILKANPPTMETTMPALKAINHDDQYVHLASRGQEAGDKNFCAVVAISVIVNESFDVIAEELRARGRKDGRGTFRNVYMGLLKDRGYKTKVVSLSDVIASYPAPHCNVLKNVTSHHPRRFPASFDPAKTYLAWTAGHVFVIKEGKVKDWSVNRALRLIALVEVVKDGE